MGPITGRGAGFCAGFAVPGYVNRGGGYGCGGGGRGRGWRHQFYATGMPGWARSGFGVGAAAGAVPTESEVETLKQQADFLQNSLTQINKRIDEIEKK